MNKLISMAVFSGVFLTGCATTLPKLGSHGGQLMPCPNKPNCVNSQATDKTHFIQPMHFSGTRQEAQDRLLHILNALKRTKITVVQDNYIRIEFTSKIFGFIDDVEFDFPSTYTEKSFINVRSASRLGYSDLGANRKRIKQIRHKFNDMDSIKR